MNKYLNLGLALLLVIASSSVAFGQKKLKEGFVKFEMSADGEGMEEMAMLGGTTLEFYFTDDNQKMDMNMLGGMMHIMVISPVKSPKDAVVLMDMMGQKIQLVGMKEEDMAKNYNFMNVDDLSDVKYDENDKKEIAGYPCYKATCTLDNGSTMIYYITEKIQPPHGLKGKSKKAQLRGYPLEMTIEVMPGASMVFKAVEINGEVPKGTFEVPEGYQKMTMEEFTEMTGGMLGK